MRLKFDSILAILLTVVIFVRLGKLSILIAPLFICFAVGFWWGGRSTDKVWRKKLPDIIKDEISKCQG